MFYDPLGTDTAGSVRVPASNCGLYGIRPSHGISPLQGVVMASPSFDTLGIFANTYDILHKVATILFHLKASQTQINTLYIPVDAFDLLTPSLNLAFQPCINALKSAFHCEMITLSNAFNMPDQSVIELGLEIHGILKSIEVWKSFGSWVKQHHFPFSEPIKESFEYIAKIDPDIACEKVAIRNHLQQKLNTLLGPANILCIPTAAEPAPLLVTSREELKKSQYAKKTLSLCSIACIGDLPQITIPCITVEGRPLGLSFLMSTQNDAALLSLGKTLAALLSST